MSRIASVKETGEELSQAEWQRFEDAVTAELSRRPEREPYQRDALTRDPRADEPRAKTAAAAP